MKLIFKTVFPVAIVITMLQCNSLPMKDHEKTLMVGAKTVDCVGTGPMKCLQVKEKGSQSWTNFYDKIDGFTYEPGFEYVLKVKTENIANPPADGSSMKYTLIKQISKTKK